MKKTLLGFLSVLFVLGIGLGLSQAKIMQMEGSTKSVVAEESSFVMVEGASFRSYYSTPNCGITFGATLTDTNPYVNNVRLFMAPYDFVETVTQTQGTITDYIQAFENHNSQNANNKVAYTIVEPAQIPYTGGVSFLGGLKNIQEGNESRRFFGIYYYETGSGREYATMPNGEVGQARSIAYLASGHYNSVAQNDQVVTNDEYMTSFWMERAIKTAVSKSNGKLVEGNKNETVDISTIKYTEGEEINTQIKGGKTSGTYFDDYLTLSGTKIQVGKDVINVGQRLNFAVKYNANDYVENVGTAYVNTKKATNNDVGVGVKIGREEITAQNFSVNISKYDLTNATFTSQNVSNSFIDTLNVNGTTVTDTYNSSVKTPNVLLTIPKANNMLSRKTFSNNAISDIGTLAFSYDTNGANGNLQDASVDIKPNLTAEVSGSNFTNTKQATTSFTKDKFGLNVAYVYGTNYEDKTNTDSITTGITDKKYYYRQTYSYTSPSVSGYTPESNVSGTFDAKGISHTVEYNANPYKVYVNYLYDTNYEDIAKGTEIYEQYSETYYYKQKYSNITSPTTKVGYMPDNTQISGRVDNANNVTHTVYYSPKQYSISINSVTGGSISLNESRKYYYCEQVTLNRTRQNRYGIDSASLTGTNYSSNITFANPSATTSSNTFKMPATDVTVVPNAVNYGSITFDSHYDKTADSKFVTYNGYYTDVVSKFTDENKIEKITYSSGDNNVVTIDSNNRFNGLKVGTATITAKTTYITETFTITVKDAGMLDTDNNNGFLSKYNSRVVSLSDYNLSTTKDFTLLMGDSFFDAYDQFFDDYYYTMIGNNFASIGISASKASQWIYFSQKIKDYGRWVPEKLVIHIGTNDIFDWAQGEIAVTETITTMLRRLHEDMPNTLIYWYSIEPRIDQNSDDGNIVNAVNENISAYASDKTWLTYLDSYTGFSKNLSIGGYYSDKVHPSFAGYDHMFSKITFDRNDNFSGQTLDFTKTSQSLANNGYTRIPGTDLSKGNYVYSTNMYVNSFNYSQTPHIAFSFSDSSNHYRFLLWDIDKNGRFYHTGDFGSDKSSNVKSFTSLFVESCHNIVILARGSYKYLFVDNVLKSCVNYSSSTDSLFISSEYVDVKFSNNFVAYADSEMYKKYDAMATTKPASGTFTNVEGITDSNTNFSWKNVTKTITNYNLDNTQQINFASNYDNGFCMIFTANLMLSNLVTGNRHVSFSLNGSHSTYRLLIWDNAGNNTFKFGGGFGAGESDSSSRSWSGSGTINIAILATNNKIYWFINEQLVKVIANLGTPINTSTRWSHITDFNIRSYGCTANFTHINFELADTNLYRDYLTRQEVAFYEGRSFSGKTIIDFNKTGAVHSISRGNAVYNATTIISNDSSFTFESRVLINSIGPNSHISFNFDSNNRFILWDDDSNGKFYYSYEKGGTITKTSSYFTYSSKNIFTVKIVVNNQSAKLYIDDSLFVSFTASTTINNLYIGAEGASVSFYGNYVS